MQNLQIKYGEFSGQAEYLARYDLLEDEDVQSEREHIDYQLESIDSSFELRQAQASSDEDEITFQGFVVSKVKFLDCITSGRIRRFLTTLVMTFAGQMVEYQYHLKHQNQQTPLNNKHAGISLNLIILINSFLLFLLVYYFPVILLPMLIALLAYRQEQVPLESQFHKYTQTLRQLKQSLAALKFYCISHETQYSNHKQVVRLLSSLVSCLSAELEYPQREFHSSIDRLDECTHKLSDQYQLEKQLENFLKGSWITKKILYWSVTAQRHHLQSIMTVIDVRMSLMEMCFKHKRSHLKRIPPVIDCYFNILSTSINRINTIKEPTLENKIQMTRYRQLLQKEISFRKILKVWTTKQTDSTQNPQIGQTQVEEFVKTISQKRDTEEPLCYVDGHRQIYPSQQVQDLKIKLEGILRRRQEEEKKTQESIETQQKVIDLKKPSREITSFGIPLLPPKRDMSQYYLE